MSNKAKGEGGAIGGGESDALTSAVVICGFDALGSSIARALSDPRSFRSTLNDEILFSDMDGSSIKDSESIGNNQASDAGSSQSPLPSLEYVGFDLDPNVVIANYRRGQRVLYGDGTQPMVLQTAGVRTPRAFVVTYADATARLKAVESLRQAYPRVPIISR